MQKESEISIISKITTRLRHLSAKQIVLSATAVFLAALLIGFGTFRAISNIEKAENPDSQQETLSEASKSQTDDKADSRSEDKSEGESSVDDQPSETDKPAEETPAQAQPETSNAGGSAAPVANTSQSANSPAQPTQPTQPAQPTQPTTPTQPTQPTQPSQTCDAAAVKQMWLLVHYARTERGLMSPTFNAELNRAAGIRAVEIASLFSHTRPDGSQWTTVSPLARAENISFGDATAQEAFDGWMRSEAHRNNILNPNWSTMGAGCYHSYWVQLFGY